MPAEQTLSTGTLFSFLLVLCRVSSAFVFVPIPGVKNISDSAKIVSVLCVTTALFPFWPVLASSSVTIGNMLIWILAEVAFGVTLGFVVAIMTESLAIAAQVIGVQAGYSYASTIDPNTEADSGVLQIAVQLLAGLLFFSVGLHRWIVRALAESLLSFPPGTFAVNIADFEIIQRLGATMFRTGLLVALPVIALLMLIDMALALLGRLAPQMQLLTLAFPVKMLAALATLAAMVGIISSVYEKTAARAIEATVGLLR